jgi:dCMP deaminase
MTKISTSDKEWDFRFLELAGTIGEWSKDPSTKVGSVIVNDNKKIVTLGYNGFPRNVRDDHRLQTRDIKYELVVHAEANAIIHATESLWGCTIYTMPFMPCSKCSGLIIQAGIKRVVSIDCDNPRWNENFRLSKDILTEARIGATLYPKEEFSDWLQSFCNP